MAGLDLNLTRLRRHTAIRPTRDRAQAHALRNADFHGDLGLFSRTPGHSRSTSRFSRWAWAVCGTPPMPCRTPRASSPRSDSIIKTSWVARCSKSPATSSESSSRARRWCMRRFPPEALEAARETRERAHPTFIEALPYPVDVAASASGPRFFAQTPWGRAELALAGARGGANAAVALSRFEALGFDPAPHLRTLSQVRWPGRMERVQLPQAPCPIYLSGDHNPQGVASLIELLPAYPREQLHLLVGVGSRQGSRGHSRATLRAPALWLSPDRNAVSRPDSCRVRQLARARTKFSFGSGPSSRSGASDRYSAGFLSSS